MGVSISKFFLHSHGRGLWAERPKFYLCSILTPAAAAAAAAAAYNSCKGPFINEPLCPSPPSVTHCHKKLAPFPPPQSVTSFMNGP